MNHALLASAVADLLKLTTKEAVEQAIQHSLQKLQTTVHEQEGRIEEAEQRIQVLEEDFTH